MKSKEELNAIKEEAESVAQKLAELSEEDLKEVTGGIKPECVMPIIFSKSALRLNFSGKANDTIN